MINVRAHSNIALIKYWGKRNESLRLPTNGSLSLTLDNLYTDTQLSYLPELTADELTLNGEIISGKMLTRVQRFMQIVRDRFGLSQYARINSMNHFPTGAGLASSASAFAALALAASADAGLELSNSELSVLARLGSGSACRSIFSGFAEWLPGIQPDGEDSIAEPLNINWPLSMAVLILHPQPKETGSGDGMAATVNSSPLYPGWLASVNHDLEQIKIALAAQDLEAVGTIMEHNALKMHASAMASQPAVIYWQPETLALIHYVRRLRAEGHACWFTIDAGPNLKVLLPPNPEVSAANTLKALREHPAVQDLLLCGPGPGAYVLAGN